MHCSDVVLEALASRLLVINFYGLSLEVPGLGFGLECCTNNFLAPPSNARKIIKLTRCWHVTISCQPDGRPSQPVRRWKSGRVHLADGSKVVVLELPYSTEFGRERRKLASGVRKYGKFDDGR